MSILFGAKPPGPTRINGVQINQSIATLPLPVVMGRAKIQQSLIWVDGFTPKLIKAGGGKGIGGGKGGTQYVYSADVIAALCHGPITGIGDVWSGQSWLSNTTAAESWTIQAGTYTPVYATGLTADLGVSAITAYALSQLDLGATSPTALSGSHPVPFQRVPYGTALVSGQYSIDGSNGYHFASADVGRTVQLAYSFTLKVVKQQETDTVPSSHTLAVGPGFPFSADGGVTYTTGANEGKALTRVSGTPTATGTYSVSGSQPATYKFAPGDFNAEVTITYELNDSTSLATGTQTSLAFSLYEGYPGQSPAALLKSNFPGAALGYTSTAYVAYFPMDLGYGAQIQQNVFEVITADGWGGSIADCNPIRCILQVLTNRVWGIGFPVSAIDTGAAGTWGNDRPTGKGTQTDSTASSWFAANGFFISPVMDRQDSAASLIGRWLEAGQCAAFMSEGLWKMVPYGDTSTAGNGAVWLAPSRFVFALDDSCFIAKDGGDEPVRPSIEPWQDAYNTVQVSWNNRSHQYAPEVTPESDQAAIDRYGSRIEDPVSFDFITTLPAATFAASMRVKRNVYTRNTYEFSASYQYGYIEPMDVGYITTRSQWSTVASNALGIESLPVRITKRVDNPDGTIDFTAEDYPFGVHQPTLYNKQLASGVTAPNLYADPGNSEVVVFEATNRLTKYKGNQIWIGATGANADWGSCNVFASMDGVTYKQIGSIETPARIGVLAVPFGNLTGDPDTNTSLVVNLVENSAMLESATTADADADNTLTFVDGELVSYSSAAVSGQDQVTLFGYIRRARMGSSLTAHAVGGLVMRLDDSIFKYTYDPSWAGATVYLKFQSVNVYGNSAQPLSALTAVRFTIPGQNPGTVDASSGLIIGFNSNSLPPNIASNNGNSCTLFPYWETSTNTPAIAGYGPGGPGTSWTFYAGSYSKVYPAFGFDYLQPSTLYYVVYDTHTGFFGTLTDFTLAIRDYYVFIGYVTTGSQTTSGGTTTTNPGTGGGGATGATGGGNSGAGSACTVAGTPLDTPSGPVPNHILKERLDAGEEVFLQGRYGPEKLVSAEWVFADAYYRVKVRGHKTFLCSASHNLRLAGHYVAAKDAPEHCRVETVNGYADAWLKGATGEKYVLRIHLSGPSNEYSVGGVWSHNFKPNQRISAS